MTTQLADAGIPILTEIIPAPSASGHKPEARVPVSGPAPASPATAANSSAPPLLSEEQFEKLEKEIRERVLYQVLERVDFVLEQRVRDSLADVLQTAVEGLASEIRSGLHHSIKDVVTRAVTHEIGKLRAAGKP